MRKPCVWVLGSSNIDATFFIDRLPRKGATDFIRGSRRDFGGKGANTAVAAAFCGASVSYVGCVGDDSGGREMSENFRRHGIGTQFLTTAPGIPSGAAYIMVDRAGDNTILVESGANIHVPLGLSPDFRKGDLLLSQYEVNSDAIIHYFALARAAGAATALNPSPFAANHEAERLADFMVVNEVEAAMLGGIDIHTDEDALSCAARIAERCGGGVVMTLGKGGAMILAGSEAWRVRGYADITVRDTQGAGDTFLGVFAAAFAAGMPLPDALLKANVAAAMSVEIQGSAQVSFPDIGRVGAVFTEQKAAGAIEAMRVRP